MPDLIRTGYWTLYLSASGGRAWQPAHRPAIAYVTFGRRDSDYSADGDEHQCAAAHFDPADRSRPAHRATKPDYTGSTNLAADSDTAGCGDGHCPTSVVYAAPDFYNSAAVQHAATDLHSANGNSATTDADRSAPTDEYIRPTDGYRPAANQHRCATNGDSAAADQHGRAADGDGCATHAN